jgi:hypothetical protein
MGQTNSENLSLSGLRLIRECLRIFDRRDQRKLYTVTIVQSFLGLLDLIGVALLGVIGALTITGVQSQEPGARVSRILQFLNLNEYKFQTMKPLEDYRIHQTPKSSSTDG